MKKIISIILGVCISFAFSACSSKNTESSTTIAPSITQSAVPVGNTITYEDVSYKVNPLLSNNEKIDYVDFDESNGMTCVEFSWNWFSNDDAEGCKDILIMYYNNSLSNVQSGKQSILGSVYCHRNDDMTTEWSYFGAEHNLIYKTVDYQIYDENDNLIGYCSQEGNFYDNEDNPLDLNSFDPFIEILNSFEN